MTQRPTEGIFDQGGIFGAAADMVAGQAQAYQAAFARLVLWGQSFLQRALPRAHGVLAEEAPCEGATISGGQRVPCAHGALFRCTFCRRTVCEGHAWVGVDASTVCIECVRVVAPQAQGAAPPGRRPGGAPPGQRPRRPRPEGAQAAEHRLTIDEALGILGCTRNDDWDAVRGAYRKLAAACHPDRHMDKPESERKSHENRFKLVNEAYNRLRAARERNTA